MKIVITSDKLVKDVQEEFHSLYPFLRIEFYVKTFRKQKETINKIPDMSTFGNGFNNKNALKIEVSPYTIVKDFESDFENTFGMYVQLYRKSGSLWQEITITDNWTIKQQDKTGFEISSILDNEAYSGARSGRKNLFNIKGC